MGNDASKETDQKQQQQPRQTREQRAAAKAQKAIGSQKQQMTIINKRIDHKEKQMFNMRNEIKKLLQGAKTPAQKKQAKRQATLKLKRIKMMEKQVASDGNQLTRLMQMEMGLEQAVSNAQTIATTQAASQAFRDINVDIDDVEDIMEDNQDMMDRQADITALLQEPMGDDIMDEDDLEAEFAALEEENAMEEMERLPGVPDRVPSLGDSGRKLAQQSLENVLPVAPTGQISTPGIDVDDDELMALEREMLAN